MTTARIVLHHLNEVTSTNDEARRLAEAGAPEGTIVWADYQTRGRGRLGRTWISEPGENLLASVILRPSLEPDQLGLITMLGAVAVADAIQQAAGLDACVLWPNDVLIRGRKVSGMLLESAQDARRGSVPRFVILGIGINVNQRAFPADLHRPATSLMAETGCEISRQMVLDGLTESLVPLYDSIEKDSGEYVHAAYTDRLKGLGTSMRLKIHGSAKEAVGRFVGVTRFGGLELELSGGRHQVFHAGEVTSDILAEGAST
jgi:BirA family biotin operon repressor/biotin-[acetyl-CoA-carboxylase] ligase